MPKPTRSRDNLEQPWLCKVLLLVFLSLLAGRESPAQTIYRCSHPVSGKVTYSKERCAPREQEETLPPPFGGETHPDVLALCTGAARKEPRVDNACSFMLDCRSGDRGSCGIYCDEKLQPYFRDVPMGPTSPVCLALTGMKRGANWVQVQPPSPLGGASGRYDAFTFQCVDPNGATFEGADFIYCKRGTTECARQQHEMPNAQAPEPLAAAVCTDKYGTRLAPRPPPRRTEAVAQARRTGIALGAGTVVAGLGLFLFWRRRRRASPDPK